MTEPRTIAVVRAFDGSNAYEAFLDALEKRRAERNVSGVTLDEIAGLAEGLTSKIMAGAKSFGPRSFGPMLGALGVGVILFEDPQALEYVASRHEKSQRNGAQVRMLANASMRTTRWLFTPRKGRKAAKDQARSMTPKQRKERARHAAMKRWRTPRIIEITAQEHGKTCQGLGNAPKCAAKSLEPTAQLASKPRRKPPPKQNV